MIKVIAKRDTQFLIQIEKSTGFIYDAALEERYDNLNIDSILARGYWERWNKQPSKEELKRIQDLPITK